MSKQKEEEFKKHTDYIRSYANNSIAKDRINQALNRIVFISREKGAESKLNELKKDVEGLPTRHASSFGIPLESKWIERSKVLKLINNE